MTIANVESGTRRKIARIARATLVVAGALAASMGPLFMTGGRQVLQVHELLGDLAIVSLWTLAVVGVRSGVSKGKAVFAAVWGLGAMLLAGAQKLPLDAGLHTVTQVLHVATSIGVIAGGLLLAREVLHARPAPAARGTMAEAAAEFLAKRRIAVTGVSRESGGAHGSNLVYRRLRERGYEVFAVNPNAELVEGDRAYPDLTSIPGGVEAVVIATRPERALDTVRECAKLGIRNVWMHRGPGSGSVSPEATAWGRANGIRIIDGGCPLMFDPCADFGHKAMRGLLTLTGKVPRRVG